MNTDPLQDILESHPSVLLYATTTDCGVCKVLRPKIEELVKTSFSHMKFIAIELDRSPDLARRLDIAAVPTVIAFFHGKEHVRKIRVFGMEELEAALSRPYNLLY